MLPELGSGVGVGGGRDEKHSCLKVWKKDCVSVRRASIDLCIDLDHGGRVPSVMKSSSLGVGQTWVQIPGVSDELSDHRQTT